MRPTSRWVVPVVLCAVMLMPVSVSGTATALPAIGRDLGPSSAGLQWAMNAFNLAFALAVVPAGAVADRWGSRGTFAFGVAAFLAGSVCSALATSYALLDGGRFVSGLGAASLTAGGAAMISATLPDASDRARAFALFGMSNGVGLALGPGLTSALISLTGWRGVFVALAGATLPVVLLAAALPRPRRPDPPHRSQVESSASGVDVVVLRNRRFLAFALVPLGPAIGYVALLSYYPTALSAVLELTPAEAGVLMLAMTLPAFVGPWAASRLVRGVAWARPIRLVYLSYAALVAGNLGMLLLGPGVAPLALVVPMLVVGLGYGLPMGLADGEAISAVPGHRSGSAAGVLNFLRSGSAALAVGGFGLVLATLVGLSLPPATAARVAAGGHGHADVYAGSLHAIVLGSAVVVTAVGLVVAWLHHTSEARPCRP